MEQATFFKKRRGEIRFKTFSYRVLSFILTIVGLAFFFAAMLDHLQQVVPLVKAISLGNEQAW